MASSSSASSSASGCWKYDVFLSFRGEDTRKTFVDHLYLYSALQQHGILTYKDDVTLDRGDTIGPSLLKAIESSQILVIIFSENYADSSWCLDELSHIMKCRDKVTGQIVFPIFYHVDPSDVRKQKRKYEETFVKHELLENNKNKVESWKKALVDASNIAGWEPKHVGNGHEAKCIQEIVDSVLVKLSSLKSAVEDEDFVGMGTRLEQLKSKLRIGSDGVRMVGIWGVGGGGKTTLATSIYMEMKISGQFHGCCFVENIREESKQQNGLKSLQEKILSTVFDKKVQVIESVDIGKHRIKSILCRRNVLIALDDVDDLEQLEALVGRHDWFGDGSRIIITTRNEQVLISHRVDEVYPVSLLSHDEAIRLFRRHAYHKNNPVEDYENLSLRVISYVNGLPLALKILGSFLYGRDKDEWLSTLARLKDHPEMNILEKLKISYDGLKPVEKELFLDIACFFRGKMKDGAMRLFDACGFYPAIGVKVLIQKALISVSKGGYFVMHDLIQEMGHYIVRGEHPYNPEKHSRVWRMKDIEDMCSRNATMENDKIEAIDIYSTDNTTMVNNRLTCQHYGRVCSSSFIMFVSNLKKLRSLRVWTGSNYDEGPSFLSNELRYIEWSDYPTTPFLESFQLMKLVILKIHGSMQKELWKGCKYLPSLKELELVGMKALVRTPDIGGLPCLQKLMLYRCGSLEEIHQSLGNHSSLVSVDVSFCHKLTRFPSIVGMEKLEILSIECCPALVEFPRIEAKMDNLVELSLYEIGIEVLPPSVGEYCTNLTLLILVNCKNLKSIEGNFRGLKKFELGACNQFENLPNDVLNENLDELRLFASGDILSHFPRFLRKLNLSYCGLKDGEIPTEIGELSNLQELDLFENHFTRFDFSLSRLTRLKLLQLSNCTDLVELPELPSSLAILEADNCWALEVIRDEIHRNCKWLCQVSIDRGMMKKNIIGGERLLETMLQGNAVESGCMFLGVQGLEIPRGFEPRLVKGSRCGMQFPKNWYNDFSGFLFCAASYGYLGRPSISMKHEEENGGWMRMRDSQHDDFSGFLSCAAADYNYLGTMMSMKHGEEENGGWMGMGDYQHDDDLYWEESVDDGDDGRRYTWVGYIPFSLLKHTSWWDPTSTAVQIEIQCCNIRFGLKLVPKRGVAESSSGGQMETTTHSSSSSSDICLDHDDDYKCKLNIEHDSKSALQCSFAGIQYNDR